ncbi:MAG TPA: sulfite exporter TauE/SafE family protein [Kofleriaceae bacterium]|nr:sulfite exporter TauE/SafE family protein [Kofleriaceae bacterium]
MTGLELAIACAVGFVAAGMGAIAGGNSLIVVPVLILLGMDSVSAVATNMFGVTFLSLAATVRFSRSGHLRRHPTLGLTVLAVPGGIVGAGIAVSLSHEALSAIIAGAMIVMAGFLALRAGIGAKTVHVSRRRVIIAYALSAVWAVYGGMFSGGYTTVLTVGCVVLFGTTLLEAVALTKIVNLVSSATATAVFIATGTIDYEIAVLLAIAMAAGGFAGAHLAIREPKKLRGVVIAIALILALALILRAAGILPGG